MWKCLLSGLGKIFLFRGGHHLMHRAPRQGVPQGNNAFVLRTRYIKAIYTQQAIMTAFFRHLYIYIYISLFPYRQPVFLCFIPNWGTRIIVFKLGTPNFPQTASNWAYFPLTRLQNRIWNFHHFHGPLAFPWTAPTVGKLPTVRAVQLDCEIV